MIDDETEQAVEGWFKLGDELAGEGSDERAACARCGSASRIVGRGADALCARCYLERGDGEAAAQSKARAIADTSRSPSRPSPR